MKAERGILSRFSLEDRIAVVTGSGHGIGKGIALAFAEVGAHIVIADLDSARAEATAQEVRALGRRALPVTVNVTNSDQVKALAEKSMAEFGKVDILVNNVGGTDGFRQAVADYPEDVWDSIITRNLKGTFLCSKTFCRIMMQQMKGNIINIASMAALSPRPYEGPYAAAKAGVVNLTVNMALEMAPYNIRVNSITPGVIKTGTLDFLGNREERAKQRGIPLGKHGQSEDIAMAAIYLASDASNYVTAINIEVQGGPPFGMQLLEMAKQNRERYLERTKSK